MDNYFYPQWAGRLSGFLIGLKYRKLPDDIREDIENIVKEYKKEREAYHGRK
jgi:hypothetical protein